MAYLISCMCLVCRLCDTSVISYNLVIYRSFNYYYIFVYGVYLFILSKIYYIKIYSRYSPGVSNVKIKIYLYESASPLKLIKTHTKLILRLQNNI